MEFLMQKEMLGVALDAVLVVAIFGLWVMWLVQSKQSKKVEGMLVQAAADLQQASALLDKVMITQTAAPLKKEAHLDLVETTVRADKVEITAQATKQQSSKQVSELVSERVATEQEQIQIRNNIQKLKATLPKRNEKPINYAAQVMRLKREGLSMAGIAKTLKLPVEQVRLMLLLQTSKI